MAGDTRQLFGPLCERKAPSWDAVGFHDLSPVRRRALAGLPVRIVPWDSSPMDHLFPTGASNGSSLIEVVVQRLGEEDGQVQYFYVNTEGYDYARYTFRFDPTPAREAP